MRIHRQSMLFVSLSLTTLGTITSANHVIALSQSSASSQTVTTSQKILAQSTQLSSKCVYDTRKTVQTVKSQKGKVTLVANNYVIVTEGVNGTRFVTCNLPDAFKTEGKAIVFSGEVKEIYPNERLVATPFKITAIASSTPTPTPTQSIQSLPNGDYRFCSKSPSADTGNGDTGYCYVFNKRGNRLVGDFYDSRTLGEVSACVSGTLNNKTVRGEAIELVGDIGNRNIPPNSRGNRLVNWDSQGYLKVARATQIGRNATTGSRKIRYRDAVLKLDGFYRYSQSAKGAPTNCINR